MKKTLILLLLLLFNGVFILSGETVKSVELSGNRNVSEHKILSIMQVKPGDEFNPKILNNDMKQLGETGFFKSVRYETETTAEGMIKIKLFLVENPLVAGISFKGNRAFRSSKLRELLAMGKGDIYNEIRLKNGIAAIEQKYREKGFYLVNLSASVAEKEEDVTIGILVEEGGKAYVREISVKGANFFSLEKIKKSMKTKERFFPFRKGSFKEEVLARDIEKLVNAYRDSGFIDIGIKKTISSHGKGGMLISLDIDEGKQFFLGNLNCRGKLITGEKELIDMLPLKKKGSVLSKALLEKNKQKLAEFHMEKGYMTVNITEIPLPADKADVIDITYNIEPGEIYRAGEIKITGNTKTRDKVIRREVKAEPLEVLTASVFRKSFNNLMDLNYFEKINIYPELTSSPGIANVIVDVEEKEKTGMFLIGGGYSSVDDLMGMISIQQTNFDIARPWSFTGGGQNLALSLELGTEARNYRLSFTEPYFLDKPVWVGTDIYSQRREWTEYTEERTGITLRAGKRWENVSVGFALKTEQIDLSEIDLAILPSIAGQEGEIRKNSITATVTHNTLDSRRTPSRGNLASLSLESAGSIFQGDVDFIKPIFDNDFYYPLKKLVFHSKTRAGFIEETGDTEDIPIYEKFFGGGIGTVRGYKERSFGPQDPVTGEPVGGKALFAQNFELLYPLYENILKGVVFFDIGNIWDDFEDFSDLRKGIGAGIKVVIPFLNAPVEIYYGHALDNKPSEDSGRWHFGMSFGF
ncbi:MAG TPA: outer membrane protein assembly factor BamA [bacterium]|nr:outer membrane protein assembly factor BamA [bacterium]